MPPIDRLENPKGSTEVYNMATTNGLTYDELKKFQEFLTKANRQQVTLIVAEALREIEKRERQDQIAKRLGV